MDCVIFAFNSISQYETNMYKVYKSVSCSHLKNAFSEHDYIIAVSSTKCSLYIYIYIE